MISLGWYDLIIVIKFLSSFWYLAFLGLATFCPAHIFSNSISAFFCSSWNFSISFGNDGCLLLTSFTKLLFQPSTALLVRGRSFFTLGWQLLWSFFASNSIYSLLISRITRYMNSCLSVHITLGCENSLSRCYIGYCCSIFKCFSELTFFDVSWIGEVAVIFNDLNGVVLCTHTAIAATLSAAPGKGVVCQNFCL